MALAMALLIGADAPAQAASAAEARGESRVFYVSPEGNDAWSGRQPAPNPGKSDGPFATIIRARDAIRPLKPAKGGPRQPVTVRLRGVSDFLSDPVVLKSQASGTISCPIVYTAYDNERVVIS